MKGLKRSNKGFTLVEIMIVVVIIGLLAAMAIPAFQKVRRNSIRSTMDNDARQMAGGAQQYFMEHGTTSVAYGYDSTTGVISSSLSEYVKVVSKKYTSITPTNQLQVESTFSIVHAIGGTRTYNPEGQLITYTE